MTQRAEPLPRRRYAAKPAGMGAALIIDEANTGYRAEQPLRGAARIPVEEALPVSRACLLRIPEIAPDGRMAFPNGGGGTAGRPVNDLGPAQAPRGGDRRRTARHTAPGPLPARSPPAHPGRRTRPARRPPRVR